MINDVDDMGGHLTQFLNLVYGSDVMAVLKVTALRSSVTLFTLRRNSDPYAPRDLEQLERIESIGSAHDS